MPFPLTTHELDVFRTRGDDVLDVIVASSSPRLLREMLGALFTTDRIAEDDARFRPLLDALSPVPLGHPDLVATGQRLFELYGPEILLILGCYGLPAAYAAANGVQVVYHSRRMGDDTQRRLCETAQMLINVMRPGELATGGVGFRSARKVRIMHALIRGHVQLAKAPWPAAYGKPINQEDLAGTLLTFSLLVLDGLRKIGVQLLPEEQAGYMAAWHHIALLLGIDARLAPRELEDAKQLAELIARRQFRPTPEGRQLTRDLLAVNASMFPVPGYGTSLMHFFLDESVFGINLAETLGLPPANWTRFLVRARVAEKKLLLRWLARVPGAKARRRLIARHFTQRLILWKRPDDESPFEVPPELLGRWQLLGPSR